MVEEILFIEVDSIVGHAYLLIQLFRWTEPRKWLMVGFIQVRIVNYSTSNDH